MAIHLIVYGHGAGDPGAGGNGTNERDFNRKILHPFIKKWTDRSKHNFVFYDISGNKDLYQDTARGWGLYSMTSKQYESITEMHEDAARATATGGHVIISSNYNPDKHDLSLAQIINKIVGWWGSVRNNRGVNGRNNLLNCNVAARRGINYRLMELGFITNKSDMDKIRNNLDAYAKGIVEGITGENLAGTAVTNPSTPNTTFNINNYHTKQFKHIKLVRDDYAYKEKALKNRVGGVVKKGTILTVTGLEYSGKYPRFKLKSGLYISTRKDIVEEYKTGYTAKKVGDTVTVLTTATKYQTGQVMAPFVKGSKYKIKQVKSVNQSNSKRAYLLDKINSWVLEQDVK